MLTRLDARRRQVALNVKIVDVNLSNTDSAGSTLSLRSGNDSLLSVSNGAASFNFGGFTPPAGSPLNVPGRFLSTLQAQITSGNGKILTDPTIVVQEGQKSSINLTSEVFGGFQIDSTAGTGATITNRKPIIREAGLKLDLIVNRIDDNGYVSVAIAPEVSALGGSVATADGDIALIQKRVMNSGDIRLRDGQTLILSGIIQETDRTAISKVPILGDIPLLGALFRSTSKQNQRQEVVVLLTPQIMDDQKAQVNYKPGVDTRLMLGR
jgi:type IV pilus assembly protein PilQ